MIRKIFIKMAYTGFIALGIVLFNGCRTPDCEIYQTGDVTFYEIRPGWPVWEGCYLKVIWEDGTGDSGIFNDAVTYTDKPAGTAYFNMIWEDDNYYYLGLGSVTIIECEHVEKKRKFTYIEEKNKHAKIEKKIHQYNYE